MGEKDRDSLTKIDKQLAEQETKIKADIDKVAIRTAELKSELRRVQAMRKAGRMPLQGGATKPAAKKADVVRIAAAVLQAGPLSAEALKAAVSKRLTVTHSLSGFALRFAEAIRSPVFEADSTGVRLARDTETLERKVRE
jgi:hypothetical protein